MWLKGCLYCLSVTYKVKVAFAALVLALLWRRLPLLVWSCLCSRVEVEWAFATLELPSLQGEGWVSLRNIYWVPFLSLNSSLFEPFLQWGTPLVLNGVHKMSSFCLYILRHFYFGARTHYVFSALIWVWNSPYRDNHPSSCAIGEHLGHVCELAI